MTQTLLVGAMLAVILGFLALAATDASRARKTRPAMRRGAVAFWWLILVVGWGTFAYVALATSGGLDTAAAWFAAQPVAMRVAMWLFLLPWTASLAIWRTGLPEALRTTTIVAIAILTVVSAGRQNRR